MVAEPWILKMGNQVSSNLKHALYHENSTKSSNKKQGPQNRQTIGILSFEVANVMSKIIHLHKSLTDNEILKLKNEILKSEGIKTLVSNDEKQLLELALEEKLDDLNKVAVVVSRLGKKCTIPALQGFEHVYGDIISGVIDIKELAFLVKDMEGMVRKMERYVNSTANLYTEMEVMNELEVATKKFQQNHHEESRKAFEQKLTWQKQDVKHLKDVSLWNQTYDKAVELLARTVCTIRADIHRVRRFAFKSLKVDYDDDHTSYDDESSQSSGFFSGAKREHSGFSGLFVHAINGDPPNGGQRQSKGNLLIIGGKGLIYCLSGSPAGTQHDQVAKRRNFEQQQIVTRANVLLLQTLYFADREKTEAAICEVLVGLNYICRYEQQQNALLDCASSFDFEDCMEWQLQVRASFNS
ncbi:hypothetical protein DH2020_004742 [Rehmannia glutinosa]|uniref:DUF3475 domain-containing protein n=1 Tax=Rehmannia glutinosa TaxID=99300 RepID=A0ABR0XQ96_REHGL